MVGKNGVKIGQKKVRLPALYCLSTFEYLSGEYYSNVITFAGRMWVRMADGARRISMDTRIVPTLSTNNHPIGKATGT